MGHFSFDDGSITLPPIDAKIRSAKLLTGGNLSYTQSTDEITITVPKEFQQPIDTIVELKLDRPAATIAPISTAAASLTLEKKTTASNTYRSQPQYAPDKATDGSDSTRWATDTETAWIEVDLGKPETFSKAMINEAYPGRIQKFELQKKVDGNWQTFCSGTTLGQNKLIKFDAVTAQNIRLNILETTDGPTIYQFQLLK